MPRQRALGGAGRGLRVEVLAHEEGEGRGAREVRLEHGRARRRRPVARGVEARAAPLRDEEALVDARVRAVTDRIAAVTRVPSTHFEPLQFLRYLACDHADADDCQFYRRHHDTIPELAAMQPGPRVYTFFLYLSDVEEGGGTKFDGGFTVQPKAGKALLWPATKAAEPFVSDPRTHHEALPVLRGTKYAANFWLHQFDYVGPHKRGCTT